MYDVLKSYSDPLRYWIGPNRKDSLIYKLDKLKDKQFPLLYKPETQSYLESLGLKISEIQQRLVFKAQLFLPLKFFEIDISPLNPNCVNGFYLSYSEIDELNKIAISALKS